jgi:hypothetical protein
MDSVQINAEANKQLSKRMGYVRITRIEETDKFTATVEGHSFNNGAYDDSFTMLVSATDSIVEENPANYPKQVTPETPTEEVIYGDDGGVQSIIHVEVTYP